MPRDYYEVLGVSRGADINEIKRAYRRLAKRYHPDVSRVAGSEERFKELNEAYQVLSNESSRARYDQVGRVDNKTKERRDSTEQKYTAKQSADYEQKTSAEDEHDSNPKNGTYSSERKKGTGATRSNTMSYDSSDYYEDRDSRISVNAGCALAFAIIVILFLVSPQIASFFLSISRAANHSAHNEVLVSFLDPRPTFTPLPTYTLPPTQTPLPTHTPLPTLTPRPTYTPFPTPTPIPAAFVIQQLETQAQLVVVHNETSMRELKLGVEDGLCSHGGVFTVHGVIEAGIDFDSIDEDSVSYDSAQESYLLSLPAPVYTSCRIEYIRLRENSFSLCNPDWDRARIFAEAQAMMELLKRSQDDELLDEAEERSTELLGDFIRTITGKPVNVIVEERIGKPQMSASCAPDVPSDWYHDISANVWKRVRS